MPMLAVMVNSSPSKRKLSPKAPRMSRRSARALRSSPECADDQEFVAAETRDQAFGADRMADAARGRDQQFVAGRVAEHIVDHLEAVQVDVQHRDLRSRIVAEPLGEFTQHRVAVEQAGQRIGARLHAQGFLRLLAAGDVLQRAGRRVRQRVDGRIRLGDGADPNAWPSLRRPCSSRSNAVPSASACSSAARRRRRSGSTRHACIASIDRRGSGCPRMRADSSLRYRRLRPASHSQPPICARPARDRTARCRA